MNNFDLRKYLAEGKLLKENENQLVIDGDFIKRKHNPFLPQEFFGGGDQQKMLHMFSQNAILYDITGELLPYLEEFGGYRSSYNGAGVIKFPLDNPRITLLNPAQKFLKPGEKYKSFNSFDDLETLDRYSAEGSSLNEEESIQLSPEQKEDFKERMIGISNDEDREYAMDEAGNVLARILTNGEAEFIEDVEEFDYDSNKVEEFAQNLASEIL
ncbi:hypothetical protein N9P60_00195 [bacterium]|nr:hypothetical protein [bacterium]MDB4319847.1 hypothetical protein [bacterium]